MYSAWIFGTFLVIFIATAAIALLDLIGVMKINDPAAKKWMRNGLLAQVIGIIVAMASMLLVERGSDAWTVYGKISLDTNDASSVKWSIVAMAPPAVEIDEQGRFRANIVIQKLSADEYDFPKIQVGAPGYATKTIHLNNNWEGIGEEVANDYIKIDSNKKTIKITSPIRLDAIKSPYNPPPGAEPIKLEIGYPE